MQNIKEIITAFGEGARRAKAAGFDAVEIHGAHGYLVGQFLSPYSNKRTDEYGGSFENRARFPLEVLANVRDTVGKEYPILYRLSSEEFVAGGLTIEDTKKFATMLVDLGVDALHVSGGVYESAAMIIQPAAVPQGVYVSNAAAIKAAIGNRVPVIVVGRIKEPAMAADIIRDGKADMIAMGRALLADSDLPSKLQAGTPEEIRRCIGCNQACIDRLFQDQDIACLGNPLTGREWQYNLEEKAATSKRVLVIGGGPGGLEASRVAALRGHDVFLYEKNKELGGLLPIATLPPHREEIQDLTDFLISQVRKLGVHVTVGRAVDESVIDDINPDAIIMATGATPIIPVVPGADGTTVVVVGCETAEFMAATGASVTIVEMLDDIAADMGLLDKALLLMRLEEMGVTIITGGTVTAFRENGVVMEKAGKEEIIDGVDTIVLALGYKTDVTMQPLLEKKKIPYHMIGDCAGPRKIVDAIYEGFLNAYQL